MDLLEKINRSFGAWYEGLFGVSEDVRPKDILRKILAALEDNRKEGFDNRVYVPNQYILEIDVADEEEKEYLLSFLDRDELEAAIRRYCQQNHYHIRGTLDFTIKEVGPGDAQVSRAGKVRVKCRYQSKGAAAGRPDGSADRRGEPVPLEERTVASVAAKGGEEGGTVLSNAAAELEIFAAGKPPTCYPIARGAVSIGRSRTAGNDLVIDADGQMSKRHARIEQESDGRFTLYDLGSTNGTRINNRPIDNRTLADGDEILLGETRVVFHLRRNPAQSERAGTATRALPQAALTGAFGGAAAVDARSEGGSSTPPARQLKPRTARIVLLDAGEEVDDYLLASETTIGRGVTNDVVLPDRSVATRHARIFHNGDRYAVENLAPEGTPTLLNGRPLGSGASELLRDGDRLDVGSLAFRFVGRE